MKDRETDLIIQLAGNLVNAIRKLEPQFESAFYRFYVEDYQLESCSSYTVPGDVFIVSALDQDEFFVSMDNICLNLMQEMEKSQGLLLITVHKNSDYKIEFEYENMKRWNISLLDGGVGIPTE